MPQTGSMPVRDLDAVSCWWASIFDSCFADARRTKVLHSGAFCHCFLGFPADVNCTFVASRCPAFFLAWTTTRLDAWRSCAVAGDPSFTNLVSGVRAKGSDDEELHQRQ